MRQPFVSIARSDCDQPLAGSATDQAYVDRLQWIIGDRRDAELAIAVRADDTAFEEGALVDDIEPLADMRRQTHCKPGQRQPLPARAAELRVGNPGCLPAVRTQCLKLDVPGHQRIDRADAEGFDAQLLAAIADPALPTQTPVAEPLDVQNDFRQDLLRLAGPFDRPEAGAI